MAGLSSMKRVNPAGVGPRLGVVTGLASEAAVATALAGDDDFPLRVACAGASAGRAAVLARQLVDAGVNALLSFGIAGALDPKLRSGDLVIAKEVISDDAERYACDADWQEALRSALAEAHLPCRRGTILGSTRLRREPGDKAALFSGTGCLAVDMESAAVGAIAAEAGLPFLAVRAVADRAQDALPALVEDAVLADGRAAVGRTLAALIRHPSQLPATLRLARQSSQALARLRRLEAVKDALFGGF
jgi:adenosylhomocysteine nucleosidase